MLSAFQKMKKVEDKYLDVILLPSHLI